jgi:hypothetical protein
MSHSRIRSEANVNRKISAWREYALIWCHIIPIEYRLGFDILVYSLDRIEGSFISCHGLAEPDNDALSFFINAIHYSHLMVTL